MNMLVVNGQSRDLFWLNFSTFKLLHSQLTASLLRGRNYLTIFKSTNHPMARIFFPCLLLLALFSCKSDPSAHSKNEPAKRRQWVNPLFFNDNFDAELSFPLWFDDSLIRANGITRITKRTFPRITGDTSDVNSQREAMPREKREYYFDDNGFVDKLVIYYYFDDREIARASFLYRGNMDNNGFRTAIPGTFEYLSDEDNASDFRTDDQSEREYSFVVYQFVKNSRKFTVYRDVETEDRLLLLKNKKYWGALSVDSILKPAPEDWVIWGTARKPYKRYKVENKVKERQVHLYKYWKSGALKQRVIQNYPFENHRSFQYNASNQWVSYIDSTFSESVFITRTENIFEFDKAGKPTVIRHQKINGSGQPFFYLETLRYDSGKQ